MSYRFHPLRDYPLDGILELPEHKFIIAKFIRRNQGAERADRNLKFVASSISPTPGEAAIR